MEGKWTVAYCSLLGSIVTKRLLSPDVVMRSVSDSFFRYISILSILSIEQLRQRSIDSIDRALPKLLLCLWCNALEAIRVPCRTSLPIFARSSCVACSHARAQSVIYPSRPTSTTSCTSLQSRVPKASPMTFMLATSRPEYARQVHRR